MRYYFLVTVFLSWCNFTILSVKDDGADALLLHLSKAQNKDYMNRIRCTRRFSVGTCAGPIATVWTYVPHIQNCTQRLGCKKATVSNRFPTRKRCMRHCKKLADLYLMLQAPDSNLTRAINTLRAETGNDTLRRQGVVPKNEDDQDDYVYEDEGEELPMMGAPGDFYGDLGTEPPEPYNGWGRSL